MPSGEPIEKWVSLAARGLMAAGRGAAGAAQKVGQSRALQTAAGAQAIRTLPGMVADKFGWGTDEEDAMRERTTAEHEEARARQQQKTQANVNTGGIHNAPQTPSTSSVMGVGKGEPMGIAMQLLKDFAPGINCTECGGPLPPNEAQAVMRYATTPMCLPCLRGRVPEFPPGAEPTFPENWQDMNKSEPMDLAWELLKAKKKPFHGYNPKKHSRKGGLSARGRAAAKRKTGANLKRPVTKKPSKLKPGGKAAKRRKSFCARMTGVKGPTSKEGKLTPKGAALKRWNC